MKNDRIYTQVYETMDYDKFSFIRGNRPVNESHVSNIMKSMKDGELISPIIVNEKKQITEGQHRFTSWKRLGRPVKYIVGKGYGIKETQAYNSNQKNWSVDTVVQSYAELGYKDYAKLIEIQNKYSFATTLCAGLLNGHTNRMPTDSLKKGEFKITHLDFATTIGECIKKIETYCPNAVRQRNFILAFSKCYKVDGFDFTTFLKRLKHRALYMDKFSGKVVIWRELIQEVYNYKTPKHKRLYLTKL